MSTEITLTRSISGCAIHAILPQILPSREDQSIKKYAKLTLSSFVFGLGTLALLVEGAVRISFAILAKLFTFLIPRQYAETPDSGVSFLTSTAVRHIKNAINSGYLTVGILIPNHENNIVIKKIEAVFENETVENAISVFSTIHINGFSETDENSAPLSGLAGATSSELVI